MALFPPAGRAARHDRYAGRPHAYPDPCTGGRGRYAGRPCINGRGAHRRGRKPDNTRSQAAAALAPCHVAAGRSRHQAVAHALPGWQPGANCQEVAVNSRVVVTTPQGDIRIQDVGQGCVSWDAPWSSGVTDRPSCWTKPPDQWTPEDLASWRSLIAEIKGTRLYALVLAD